MYIKRITELNHYKPKSGKPLQYIRGSKPTTECSYMCINFVGLYQGMFVRNLVFLKASLIFVQLKSQSSTVLIACAA